MHPEQEISTEKSEPVPRKRSLLGKLFVGVRRILYSVIILLLLLCISVIAVTQIPSFRQWALGYAQDAINAELTGRIEIGDIEFHWFDGIHIYNVTLFSAGDTLASIPRLDLAYDANGLLNNSIIVNNLTLESPVVKLLRGRDSVWNIDRFAKPSTDTTAGKPFDWPIMLRGLMLNNASVTVFDSTAPASRSDAMDFSRLFLRKFNVQLSGGANLAASSFDVRMRDMNFVEQRTNFTVKQLKFHASADTTNINIRRLRLETPATNLKLKANISGNIFSGLTDSALAVMPLSVNIDADSLATEDMRLFLPDMGVYGHYKLKVDATGTLPEIAVNYLLLDSPTSHLAITARVLHLDQSQKLRFVATISESAVNYDELRRIAPVLYLPEMDFLGTVQLKKVVADIAPNDSLAFNIAALTKSGEVNGLLTLFTARDTLAYRVDVATTALNLGKITHNAEMNSSLNGRIQMKGQGTTLGDLNSTARIELNASHLGARNVRSLLFSGSSAMGGIITIDTLNVSVPDSAMADMPSETNGIAKIHGTLDLRSAAHPIYDVSAECLMFPVNRAVGFSFPLTLDGEFRLAGTGFHPDSLEGSFESNFKAILLEDRSLVNLPLYASIHRGLGGNRRVLITSRLVDLDLEGKFTFTSLIRTLEHQVAATLKFIEKKVSSVAGKPAAQDVSVGVREINNDTLHLRLQADIRDLSPITLYLKTGTIISSGWLRGSIDISGSNSSIALDTIAISKLNIHTKGLKFISDTVYGSMNLRTSRPDSTTTVDYLKFNARWDTSFVLNENTIIRPAAELLYDNHELMYSASGGIKDLIYASVKGKAIDKDTTLEFRMSNLKTDFQGLTWENYGEVAGGISPSGFWIDTMSLMRTGAEVITVHGSFHGAAISDGRISVKNFPLTDIQILPYIPADVKDILKMLQGKISTLNLTVNGAMSNPKLTVMGDLTNISYNNVAVGNQHIDVKYADSMITGDVTITNPKFTSENKTLYIGIEQIPMNLAFTTVKNRLSKTEPVIIVAQAKRLSMAVLGPFVPGVKKLQGFADAEITIEGVSGDITYGGKAKIYAASLVTLSTNIAYNAEAMMSFKNNIITIDNFRLKNIANDLQGGVANIAGRIILKEFSIDSLDLHITTPGIMLLSDASVATMPTMYGRFIAATPDTEIHLYGTLDNPFLRGGLSVMAADIIMPPDRKIQAGVSKFRYVVHSSHGKLIISDSDTLATDSNKVANVSKNPSDSSNKDSVTSQNNTAIAQNPELLPPSLALTPQERKARVSLSFADKMDYDLTIKIPRRITLRMILGKGFVVGVGQEEVRAEVLPLGPKQALRYIQRNGNPQLYGALTLSNNSEYQFVKVFSATGSLSFYNGEISNPVLNLDATYSGRTSGDNKPFKVILSITGTKQIPKVAISYEMDGVEQNGDPAQVRGDALTLLVLGRTQDKLFSKSGSGLGNEVTSSLSSVVSQMAASLLEGTGIVQSASVEFDEGVQDFSHARLNLSGQFFGDVAWRYGGSVDDINNSEFSIDVPLNFFADYDILRNIMLQLTRSVNPNASASVIRRQKEWEIKLGYREVW